MTPESIERGFARIRAAADGITVGFFTTLAGMVPVMVSMLVLGSGWVGLGLSAVIFAVLGVKAGARKIAREDVDRRLARAEALAAGQALVIEALVHAPRVDPVEDVEHDEDAACDAAMESYVASTTHGGTWLDTAEEARRA